MTEENQSSAVRKPNVKWRVVDIVVAAIVAVASGVIFWAWDFIYAVPTALFDSLTPGLGGLFHFMWLFAGPLVAIIIRKPGAAFFGETIAAVIETLLGNPFGVAHALLIGMAQGLGAEIGFAVFAYRKWNLLTVTLAGALTGLSNGLYEWVVTAGWSTLQGVVFTVCCVISGAVFGGALMWFVQKALAKTGVLDRFESGKADEREFEGGLFPDLGGGKLRIALQGQGHILGEGHGAPQRAALEEQAHAAEKFLALAFGPGPKVLSPVEHLPLCRLEQAHEDAQERAFAASARPHDDEYVLTVYREVEILLHDVAAVADRKVPRFDDGCGGIHIFKILQRMVRTAVDSTMPTME